MSVPVSGEVEDLSDLMNIDCWRAVLDNVSNSKDMISLADASPDLEDLLDERDDLTVALAIESCGVVHRTDKRALIRGLLKLRHLSTSRRAHSMIDYKLAAIISSKFDVEPPSCYHFDSENIPLFLAHFEGHVQSPFVYPACQFNILSDLAVTLLSEHGRHLRQVKISFGSTESRLLENMAGMLNHLPNIQKLVVTKANYLDVLILEPFSNPLPPCPRLTQLKLKLGETLRIRDYAPLYFSLIRGYGHQLTRLSLELACFSIPGFTQQDLDALAKLQRLEICFPYCVSVHLPNIYETLALAQWTDLKEIRLPVENCGTGFLFPCFQCLQSFRATLEAAVLDSCCREHLSFDEKDLRAAAHHAAFPNLVELGLVESGMFPTTSIECKYFAKVFPNLRRLRVIEKRLLNWSYEEDVHYLFQEFPKLEEIKVERTGDGVVLKRRTGLPSLVAHLTFPFKFKMRMVLEPLIVKLGGLSNIQKLTVELAQVGYRNGDVNRADLVQLPPCPQLTQLDVTKMATPNNRSYEERRTVSYPFLGSLFNSYGHQLRELSVNMEAFYADVPLASWKLFRNLQVFRASFSANEWSFAFSILARVKWPQLRELWLETVVPFDVQLVMILSNFRESLNTLRIDRFAAASDGPRVWVDEQVPNLSKLMCRQPVAGDRGQTRIWSAFSRFIPNLRELDFVKAKNIWIAPLRAKDFQYFGDIFRTLDVIKLVDEQGRQLYVWGGGGNQ